MENMNSSILPQVLVELNECYPLSADTEQMKLG